MVFLVIIIEVHINVCLITKLFSQPVRVYIYISLALHHTSASPYLEWHAIGLVGTQEAKASDWLNDSRSARILLILRQI